MATILDREGKIKAAMLEAAAIVDDYRSQCIGGFMVAIDLWELAILPSLINNAGTWTDMSKEAEEKLEERQLYYVRLILHVPVSTPKIPLRWETGLLSMKHRVEREKLMLVHHLKQMEEGSLARQVYDEQIRNNWPGLAEEARTICARLRLEDVNRTECSKNEFKEMILKAVRREDEVWMRDEMEGKTKTKDLVTGSCLIKDYFSCKSLTKTREIFRIRTNMNDLKGNFKNRYKNTPGEVSCEACGLEDEVNSHIIKCVEYADLRQGKDLSNNGNLVMYFRDVMSRRDIIMK